MDILRLLRDPKILDLLTVELEHTRVDQTQHQPLKVDLDGNELLISEEAFRQLRGAVTDLFNAVNGLKVRSRYEAAAAISSRVTCQSCIHRCTHTNTCWAPERGGQWYPVTAFTPGCAAFHDVSDYCDSVLAEIAESEEEF